MCVCVRVAGGGVEGGLPFPRLSVYNFNGPHEHVWLIHWAALRQEWGQYVFCDAPQPGGICAPFSAVNVPRAPLGNGT